MVSCDIRLRTVESVREFVNLVNEYPFYIAVRQGRAMIDAKSILGIFSLDITQPLVVDIYSDNCGELLDALDRYGT